MIWRILDAARAARRAAARGGRAAARGGRAAARGGRAAGRATRPEPELPRPGDRTTAAFSEGAPPASAAGPMPAGAPPGVEPHRGPSEEESSSLPG